MKKRERHGFSKTRIYKVWEKMKERCNNKRNISFNNYGNKGIFVCEEWNKFSNFYKWAMENGYDDNLFIDRIDNNKGYYPDNCRFVTRKQNNDNRSITLTYEYKGKSQTIQDWANEYRINYFTLRARLIRQNLSIEEALLRPLINKVVC